ncbi:hypothetical protein AAY473_008789 [Plecturocebus cupreus]
MALKCFMNFIFQFFVEMGSHYVAQAGHKLLTSSNPPALASQRETGLHHVGQASPKLLTSNDPPPLASQRAGITGFKGHSPATHRQEGSMPPSPYDTQEQATEPEGAEKELRLPQWVCGLR